jgi:hypothetical protein
MLYHQVAIAELLCPTVPIKLIARTPAELAGKPAEGIKCLGTLDGLIR